MFDKPLLTLGFLEIAQRKAVTVEEMKQIEDAADSTGISRLLMMENAGSNIARFVFQNLDRFYSEERGKVHVLLVAGIGNNGGDCFVAARHLSYWSRIFEVTVAIIGSPGDIKAIEAKSNYEILSQIPSMKLMHVSSDSSTDSFSSALSASDATIVGIFGTGFRGEPRPLQRLIINLINENTSSVKISVDVPSGLDAETGNSVMAVRSDYTITMHAPKIGLVKNETARTVCGKILVANIGIPK